jgi:hypothetical protein
MGKIQELYDSRVRQMNVSERLQLAKMILNDLVPSVNEVDVSDEWNEDDLTDLTAFSTRSVSTPPETEEKANEPG